MVLKVFVFACCLLLFLNFAVLPHSYYSKKKNEYTDNLENARSFPGNCLMIGDSHGEILGQDINEFKCYNLSRANDSIFEMYLKLLYVLGNNPNIDTVVVSSDFHLFQERKEHTNNQYIMRAFLSVDDINKWYDVDIKYNYSKISTVFDPNLYTYFRKKVLRKLFMKEAADGVGRGEGKAWAEMSREKRVEDAKNFSYIHLLGNLSQRLINAYEEIVNLCKQNHIRLVAVRFPVTVEYHDSIAKEFREKIENVYENFDVHHFLDYEQLIDDPQLFTDRDHLNDRGAKVLIDKMTDDLGDALSMGTQ
ncbi:MAG: hypothetical protein KAJ70_00590 [Candidatus Omnitrophica bacterium]|nr:hypothetical protein [Candidatus Omnitrophota bacterium]